MSHQDQCPSTTKGEKHKPGKHALAETARAAGTINGARAWRSLEDQADSPEFRDWIEREFPEGASELAVAETGGRETRRDFLKLMGASMALAGAAMIPGCRRPDHKILAYSKDVPEEIIPGKPLYYATSMPRPDGGAEGLLVETHEGRPTKIEGNPLHPVNNGKCSIWALASILGMYDPDRLKTSQYQNPARGRLDATWDDFRTWGKEHFKAAFASGGKGVGFVYGKVSSPTLAAQRAALREALPGAKFVAWAPAESTAALDGSRIAFGKPMRESFNITKPRTEGTARTGTAIILSLDNDFLCRSSDELVNSRGFAAARQVLTTKDDMTRLYVVESGFSLTGAQADHRLRLAPSRVTAFAVRLAQKLCGSMVADPRVGAIRTALDAVKIPAGTDFSEGAPSADAVLDQIALDLANPVNRGRSLVTAGPAQPPEVHALVIAINAVLENIGNSVLYREAAPEEAANGFKAMAELVAAINAGEVSTVVCMGVNPLYDAPAAIGLADAWKKLKATVTLGAERTETADASTWALNGAHYLESWGDTVASDGTIAPVQPMIAPLYEPAMSELEFTSLLAGKDFDAKVDGHEIVRKNWQKVVGGTDFERKWRRALHDGVLAGTSKPAEKPAPDLAKIGAAMTGMTLPEAPSAASLEVAFTVGHLHDGRYANCPWLQELPATGTRTVWDNPALMSPATAEGLGLAPEDYSKEDPAGVYTKPKYPQARVAELKIGGRTLRTPVWILPGMADNTVLLTLGFGRTACGLVGDGVGVDVSALRDASGSFAARGASASATADRHMVASTQNHWSLEGRTSIVRAVDLAAWQKFGDQTQKAVDTFYANQDRVKELNFAERLGELSHLPPNVSIYENPYNRSKSEPDPTKTLPGNPDKPAYQRNQPAEYGKRHQWGMTIDLNSCTGCGACTVACQSENNIPVVGKKEVAKGREMTWIRVDRYYTGDDINSPEQMYHQPVACVHCENAPCEVVCPVNATVHGPEGHNYMAYNRCIGTRYCANNCPYKVRRFNFFDYGVTKFNGSYLGKDTVEAIAGDLPGQEGITGSKTHNKINPNLIPPRVREKLDEISRMKMNPDVTVRSRGVMEKCTYCIQRTNAAKIEVKLQGMEHIPEGFVQTACQQACPSDSIIFGDILDEKSRVRASRGHARSYELLGYLNTRPRTSHMVRVMNPNPAILGLSAAGKARMEEWDHLFDHGGSHEGHDHAAAAAGYRFDRTRKVEDRGYALSLNVLSGGRA